MNSIDISQLSLQRLIGQMIIARLNVIDFLENEDYKSYILNLVKSGIGGFCLFQGNRIKTNEVINTLQNYSPIPLIFCGDYENGLTMRLEDGTSFPHAMAIGKSNYPNASYEVSKAISEELKEIGIHWNLAPVADINSNKDNPVINIRAYGVQPENVKKNIIGFIKASNDIGIISCLKHFPGHGDTNKDSHLELPIIKKSLDDILHFELLPFIEAIKAGVPSIMIAHLALPLIESSNLPASLSKEICKHLLRDKLNYNGIIITDALEMKAIKDNFTNKEIIINGLEADLDYFLMPNDSQNFFDDFVEIVKYNQEYKNKILQSVKRIFELKEKYGVFNKPKLLNNLKINTDYPKIALEVALGAVKSEGDLSLLPIKEELLITTVAILQDDNLENPSIFFNMLSSAIDNDISFCYIDSNITQNDIDNLVRDTFLTDLFIFPIFIKSKAYNSDISISNNIIKAINEIKGYKQAIVVFLGNPYISEKIEADLKLFTYSDSLPSLAATVVKLTGREARI